MGRSDRKGRSPSESLFNNGHDVREINNIRMIWQPSTTQNTVQLTLGFSHDIRVSGHCKEKTTQGSVCLEGSENGRLAEAMMTRTVSDIPDEGIRRVTDEGEA